MLSALAVFDENLRQARSLTAVYNYLTQQVISPHSYDDLLRSQLMYAGSAFDKLAHDVVRLGMMEVFGGVRSETPKYRSEGISLDLYGQLTNATVPPREQIFEQDVVRKLGFLSFQDPDKLCEALALFWPEQHRWQTISTGMGVPDASAARTQMKLIYSRRNSIVHQADIDPTTGARLPISMNEANAATDFLDRCGHALVTLVR